MTAPIATTVDITTDFQIAVFSFLQFTSAITNIKIAFLCYNDN